MRKRHKAGILAIALLAMTVGPVFADESGPSDCSGSLTGSGTANMGVTYELNGWSTVTESSGGGFSVGADGTTFGVTVTGTTTQYNVGTYTGSDGSKLQVRCDTYQVTKVISKAT